MTYRYTKDILALIPARSGSKSIPHKNVRLFAGKPLMAHSIEQARQCQLITRVMVSTDSEEYAAIARAQGAETPFLRPTDISGDAATDLEAFQHALSWLAAKEGGVPELVVHLRPTHPNRTSGQIGEAIHLLQSHPEWDSVRSVVPAPETPFKMWFRREDGLLESVIKTDIPEAHSRPRQTLPATFLQNACIDVIRSRTILEHGSIAGSNIGAYVMDVLHDIDTPAQLAAAESAFRWAQGLPKGKTFVFDIDGVIASITPGNDYNQAGPLRENIARINRLFDAGNRIVLLTARGYVTKIDWAETTRRQMAEWGVRHHELHFGKPAADFYVDDKMISLAELAALDTIN
jgi:CMP-N,N'-diacetyllegionaminic acid synthase